VSITAREFARKLAELGYRELTPIQKVAIPLILKGHDVLVMAPTGHGKTEAAVFPVFYEIASNGLEPIDALYVTPLRALNRDIANRISRIGEALGVKVMTRHGDTPQSERRRISASPPHVLITTPESLQFLILQDSYRRAFQNLRFVIVDEVQELLDDKRGLELSIVLERLKRIANRRLQMIGLSATVGDVETAKRFLNPSGEVEVASVDAVNEMEVRVVTAPVDERVVNEAFKAGLKPQLYARLMTLKELVEKHKPVLVFTNVRDTAEFLASELKRLSNLELEVHHGSLSKDVRLEVERRLKEGEVDAGLRDLLAGVGDRCREDKRGHPVHVAEAGHQAYPEGGKERAQDRVEVSGLHSPGGQRLRRPGMLGYSGEDEGGLFGEADRGGEAL